MTKEEIGLAYEGEGGLYSNVLRISPPLIIGRAEVEEFARRLDASLLRARAMGA